MAATPTIADHAIAIAADTIRIERLLPGPIERVWAHINESELRRRWLAASTGQASEQERACEQKGPVGIGHDEGYVETAVSLIWGNSRCGHGFGFRSRAA